MRKTASVIACLLGSALIIGCSSTAKIDPADMSRIEGAVSRAEAAANNAEKAAGKAADASQRAEAAAQKAEAIFAKGLHK
jgi:hypothetical protein